jgi:Asp/Glu/hydantoin racemase
MSPTPRRIAIIHALQDSQVPTWTAFRAGWPEAYIFNLMDDSLPRDLVVDGLEPLKDRFMRLGRYAADTSTGGHQTDAILFTCSAFGPALQAVQKALSIPVLRPNETAFEEALQGGQRIGLMTTFGPALPPLKVEVEEMAAERELRPQIFTTVAEGALEALQAGRTEEHDRIAAEAACRLPPVDVLVLGQFSLARAANAIKARGVKNVITTPESAVRKLRRVLNA